MTSATLGSALSPVELPTADRPPLGPDACASIAATLAASPQRWLRFTGPGTLESRWFQRVVREARYEAWILGWAPGHELDFHDHGPSSGAIHVLRGALLEQHTSRGSADAPHDRYLLARSTVSFGPDHVHSVTAAGPTAALSIHVYSPPLDTMTHYDVAPGSVPVATSTEVC
ncbi:MAG: cysteine dioxygenase [Actinomycetia bacterium]|nr:cysteine dioxygenase [Actinomycetes bacterium]